jgi:hypothetical protein
MLVFESVEARWESSFFKWQIQVARTKIPGGWLVGNGQTVLCFVPDPQHRWDGSSLPDTKEAKQSPN